MKVLGFLSLLTFSSVALAQADLATLKDSELKEEIQKRASANQVSLSYKAARVKMFNVIYLEKDEQGFFNKDVYCLTKHYRAGVAGEEIPDHTVFNTEHTWPQSRFNEQLNEEVQKTDLHHLFPTFSKINAERGNYPFANVGEQSARKLQCDISKLGKAVGGLGNNGTYFEPANEHKGNVARALFYFSTRYELAIDPTEEIFLKFWHLIDPVDALEKSRHEIISGIQKNRNAFIDNPELVLQISDF